MNWRIMIQSVGAFLAAFALIACASAQPSMDDAAPKIIAIGDLHGDYDAYENLLNDAGLINRRGRWSGGDAIFVQTGDVPDRGPDSLKIIRHLQKLKRQARRKGGKVITLVGNHEAMNITGDLRYVHPGEYDAFKTRNSKRLRNNIYEANRELIEAAYLEQDPALPSNEIKARWEEQTPLGMIEHQRAWRGGEIGSWVAENPAVVIIGDSLYVHGGISEKYAVHSVEDLNRMVAEALDARDVASSSIINDEAGPLWYRGLIRRKEATAQIEEEETLQADSEPAPTRLSIEEEIDLVLNTFGVKRIIVGHTPSLTGIAASYGGKLIQIDTGIAAYYGGMRSFLRIEDGVVYAHDNGVVTMIGGDQ